MIDGETILVAHLGYPTGPSRAPMIYNPYFEKIGVNAVVMPMGVKPESYAEVLDALPQLTNIRAPWRPCRTRSHRLLTWMKSRRPRASPARGNAILRRPDGSLVGDLFDGEGFVRGVARKGRPIAGESALAVGCGGVGSAIAASLAAAGVDPTRPFRRPFLFGCFTRIASKRSLSKARGANRRQGPDRLQYRRQRYAARHDEADPLPMDVDRIAPSTFVGEVVMKQEMTPFLRAARAKGCAIQIGVDMLFEQIPAYLEFFGFPTTTPEELRAIAKVHYRSTKHRHCVPAFELGVHGRF